MDKLVCPCLMGVKQPPLNPLPARPRHADMAWQMAGGLGREGLKGRFYPSIYFA
ncbi:MAG TPA: hypothetical protein ACFYD6_14665 [Candidatus Brocadiia bacterium]|nr:hypothetical protein [Candidatus Brocadiales bacterium]